MLNVQYSMFTLNSLLHAAKAFVLAVPTGHQISLWDNGRKGLHPQGIRHPQGASRPASDPRNMRSGIPLGTQLSRNVQCSMFNAQCSLLNVHCSLTRPISS